jgi:hypothetical protein
MFSNLSSFLPTALQGNQEPKEVQPSSTREDNNKHEELDAQNKADDMVSAKKKGKKDKVANEVCGAIPIDDSEC